jgi:hypothetical protein
MTRSLFFLSSLGLFVSCEESIKGEPGLPLAEIDAIANTRNHFFTDDQTDSLWIRDVITLWSHFFLDTSASRIQLINETEHPPEFPSPPHYNGDFYYLEYEVDHGAFYMRYCQNGIQWTQAIWREDQLVFLEESCFNYAWSRCGIGFNRRSIFRDGRLVDEWWRTAGDRTKEEFDGDVCNCLTPMDFDQLAELHKKCRFHQDSR